MSESHTFTIQSLNAPTVLPRVALLFSRRGVPIERLEMFELDGGEHTVMGLSARCALADASKIEAQLRRIVEVIEVNVRAHVALLDQGSRAVTG